MMIATQPALSGLHLVHQFVSRVFPLVEQELAHWTDRARRIPVPLLREQALASIAAKKFHCQGGSVYALYPETVLPATVRFIVAFQTISDYLDNLCDRAGSYNEIAFRRLHCSMMDAVHPQAELQQYYQYFTPDNDGGYLDALVQTCQQHLATLPSYPRVAATVQRYVELYSDLQSLKHLDPAIREERLHNWAGIYLQSFPGLSVWEFSAATGSTLGIFLLVAAANNPLLEQEQIEAMDRAYFPWVNGLHILLDYFIDSQEDREHGDLNFTFYYKNYAVCRERLALFISSALLESAGLKYSKFHQTVVRGLLALYLSDPKALTSEHRAITRYLLRRGGVSAYFYQTSCCLLRSTGII